MTSLRTPPKLAKDTLRIIPMGGLGEVGRNMTAFEINGRILIVDCGVLFPESTQPGVDLILPDWSPIADRLDDVSAIVLTHGHEDHIGAVPYLLKRKPDIPLIGSQLTLAFVEAKLKEHRIKPYSMTVKEGDKERLRGFDLEFIAVNHSIPDALAVAITTAAGTVLHTGDFKMDQLPLDHRVTDLRAFARVGEAGLDLLMADSTNADVPGFIATESEIGPVLGQVISQSQQRVVVASFSSHVHRVQQVINASVAAGRKVALVGRSMVRNMGIAADLGYLHAPDGALVGVNEALDMPQDKVVYMCTGSQGEPMAALSRMATGEHKVEIEHGDTVILASSLIPGNENSVYRIINELMKLGADVVHKGNAKVHVSGHCAAGELLYVYNILRPKYALPVHGEYRHLIASGELAVKTGVPRDHVVLAEGGTVVDMHQGQSRIVGQYPCEYVYVDGKNIGGVTEDDLSDRRVLSEEGFISAFVVVNTDTRSIVVGPEVQARGFAEDNRVFGKVVPKIRQAVQEALDSGTKEPRPLSQVVRRTVGRWVSQAYRRRPMILPTVLVITGQDDEQTLV